MVVQQRQCLQIKVSTDDRFAAACFWFAIICAINPAVPFLSLFIVKIIELFMLHEYSGLPSRSDGTAETKLWASLARLEIGTISHMLVPEAFLPWHTSKLYKYASCISYYSLIKVVNSLYRF